jgi:hypothetical protein
MNDETPTATPTGDPDRDQAPTPTGLPFFPPSFHGVKGRKK